MDTVHIGVIRLSARLAPQRPPARATYRHGDLRRALIAAGVALAREGGPQAVVLREATRRAGVVPNAAYRHFAGRDDLLAAVRAAALAALAQAIEAEIAALARQRRAVDRARATLRAVGTGYLRFARAEPGLFRTAFALPHGSGGDARAKAGARGLDPFELLGAALDGLVEAGALPAARRPEAEFLAWSAVHGLAMLVIDGPLAAMPAKRFDALGERVVSMVERGL